MDKEELEKFFLAHYYARYEREHWDGFVKDVSLKLEIPAIHITGTNGKGSTANFLAHIYMAAGYHVATFTTPAFYSTNEIIQIDGQPISDEDLLDIFGDAERKFQKHDLSSFEIQVYIGYTYFNRKKPDLAIIEVGMGGALDATNIITPALSIITSVSLEHTAYLGRTISEIAYSKGGIIKEGVPVLTGKLEDSAASTIQGIAKKLDSPYFVVDNFYNERLVGGQFHFDYRPYQDLVIQTEANYQLKNAAVAVEATKILQEVFPCDEEALRKGLLVPSPILRLERHGNIVIDGAHNPEAVEALCRCWNTISRGKPVHVLFASFRDKNIAVELPLLGKDAASVTLTTFSHVRARTEPDYFLYEADYPFVENHEQALDGLLGSYPNDVILICGSLAFAAVMRKYVIEVLKK